MPPMGNELNENTQACRIILKASPKPGFLRRVLGLFPPENTKKAA